MGLVDSEAEFEREMDAISTVYSLRPGHVLSQADFDAIQLYDEIHRRDETRAVDVFHQGYTQGLREGGSADIEKLHARLDEVGCKAAVDRALRLVTEQRLEKIQADVRDFIHALDRGYLACKDDSAFIDALRAHVTKPAKARPA